MNTKKIPIFFILILIVLGSKSQTILVIKPDPDEGKDATVRTDQPNTNYGDDPNYIANAWTFQGDFFIQRSYIDFSLDQIPANSEIISAKLNLYCNITSGHHQLQSGYNQSNLRMITEEWDESSITWDNQPTTTIANQIVLPTSSINTQNYLDIDILSLINEILTQGDSSIGLMIKLEVEDTYNCMVFASSDHSDRDLRPEIIVIYSECAPPIAIFDYYFTDSIFNFVDHSSNSDSWLWNFGDGQFSTVQNPSHQFHSFGKYLVCLTIEDSCGQDTFCDTIHYCIPPVAKFDFDIFDDIIYFNNYSSLADSIFWDFGDGNYSSLENPEHHFSSFGEYLVCLMVFNDCDTAYYCDTILYCIDPVADFYFTNQEREYCFYCNGQYYDSLYWDFGDNLYSTIINPVHLYDSSGEFNICLHLYNQCGNSNTCKTINISIPEPDDQLALNIFPNPSDEIITIKIINLPDLINEINIDLYDDIGRLVHRYRFKDNLTSNNIDVTKFADGVYYLNIQIGGNRFIEKFVICKN